MSELGVWLAQQCQEDRDLLLKYQPKRFAKRGKVDRYCAWLTDFGFIEMKLDFLGVQALIDDYDLARVCDLLLSEGQSQTLRLIQGVIRKSAHVLERDKTQLAGQFLGRLLPHEVTRVVEKSKYFWEYLPLIGRFTPRKPVKKVTEKISSPDDIQAILEQAKQWKDSPWLRPLKANLERANEGAVRTLVGHSDSVNAVAIAPDGKTAISASDDKTLKIWDTETGTELRTLTGHTYQVLAVAIAPDGKTAISASYDKTLKIWDTETGSELKTLTGHSGSVYAVAIAPDGKTAISASNDHTLKIWDTETGSELKTLTGHSGSVNAVAIAPDGKTAISASYDCTLKIWDTETGSELKTLTCHSDWVLKTLTGYTDNVKAVAIAPDGKTAISASQASTLQI
ncbi:WD40 repeat domain-containing protein, partial [Microcoleus sp. N9_A1]